MQNPPNAELSAKSTNAIFPRRTAVRFQQNFVGWIVSVRRVGPLKSHFLKAGKGALDWEGEGKAVQPKIGKTQCAFSA